MKKLTIKRIKKKKKPITLKNQQIILKNISLLLDQGYSINKSIKLLDLKESKYIYEQFLQGESFSNILENLKFDKDILLVIKISEISGTISFGITRSYKIINQKLKNKEGIFEKLKYPLMLMILLMFALFFISNFLLPMFLKVYDNFGIEVTGKFLIFITILINLPKLIFLIIIIIFIIMIYYKTLDKSDRLKFILKHKIIKNQYYKLYNNIFLFNLYSLLSFGVKLDEVFLILAEQKYNYILQKECSKIYKALLKGEDLGAILIKHKIYNKKIIVAINSGINSNTLLENLNSILLFEDLKQKKRINKITMLIQPIIYLIFGITIVLLYMSIFIPMFKVMDAI